MSHGLGQKYATKCHRCGDEAALPTLETLVAYVRQHEVSCPPRCARCPLAGRAAPCNLNCDAKGQPA